MVGIDDGAVRFRWKNYRAGGRVKTMTLAADEFIRRLLLHVLPDGFQRIRHYGFLANRSRQQKLDRCRQLLAMPPPKLPTSQTQDYRDRYQQFTGQSLKACPACGDGRMVIRETFGPAKTGPQLAIPHDFHIIARDKQMGRAPGRETPVADMAPTPLPMSLSAAVVP